MEEIINYFKETFKSPQLVLQASVLIVAAVGLIVCTVLALCSLGKKKKSKLSVEDKPTDDEIHADNAQDAQESGENLTREENANSEDKNSEKDIPAMPLGRKTKYEKPVTRLVLKDPSKRRLSQQDSEDKKGEGDSAEKRTGYEGKWIIEKRETDYIARLKASNGELLLSSLSYTAISGVKSAITTIKNNLAAGNATVTVDKTGKFVFKVFAASGRVLALGEIYEAKYQCEKALASAVRFARTAVITVT